jgi:hypothetical protein
MLSSITHPFNECVKSTITPISGCIHLIHFVYCSILISSSTRITPEEMSYFTRGPAIVEDIKNPTQFPNDIYNLLVSMEQVHANFSGMKESLVDAGKFSISETYS